MRENGNNKAVTMTMIAQELGLSVSAISYVLNVSEKRGKVSDRTAQRIIETAKRMGYIPNVLAQSLRRQRTGVIGVIFGTLAHNWAEMSLLGMRSVFEPASYLVYTSVSYWNAQIEEQEINSFMQRRVEGIICVPTPESRALYEKVVRQGFPLVFLNDTLLSMKDENYITWDAYQATKIALEHLIKQGYRRIGFIGANHKTLMTQARYRAYVDTLKQAGLPAKKEWISWEPNVERMLDQVFFKAKVRPDALYATVDALAVPALIHLETRGVRVPDDVALIGMGNLPGTEYPGVGLSTMCEPIEELGANAAQVVLEIIRHPEKAPIQVTLVKNELMARRTTLKKNARISLILGKEWPCARGARDKMDGADRQEPINPRKEVS